MPSYEYGCRTCGSIITVYHGGAPPKMPPNCPNCHTQPSRRFGFNTPSPNSSFQTHFNNSVGKVVRNPQEFKDELKRASEAQTLRTGVEHNYVPRDPRDKVGVTEEGLHEHNKSLHDLRSK